MNSIENGNSRTIVLEKQFSEVRFRMHRIGATAGLPRHTVPFPARRYFAGLLLDKRPFDDVVAGNSDVR
jgi:hypothetical protein